MKEYSTLIIAAIAGTVSTMGIAWGNSDSTSTQSVAGKWHGTITFDAVQLRIGFEISETSEHGYAASMSSIDQSAVRIPMSAVKLNGDSVRLEIDAIRSAYEGKFTADGNAIEGNWLQYGTTTPLVMKRVDKLPEIIRPQTPKKPYPYIEEEVAYENQSANVHIAGFLTLPKEKGPFPAVLLITGSGALDRDETVSFHKPFLVLADHLTRRGIAVLRVDKRGVGKSTAEKKIRVLHATLTDDEKKKVGWPDHELNRQIVRQLRPHWRYDLRHDPCAILRQVRCPVLALGAELDRHVPAKENLAGIEQALKAGGNTRFTIREFPGMNHGFQTVPPDHTPGKASDGETMSPLVLQTISDWIIAQTGTTKGTDM